MEIQRVERPSEVNIKGFVPLTGKDPSAVLQREDALVGQLFIVRCRPSSDVRRHRVHRAGAQVAWLLPIGHFGYGVALSNEQAFRPCAGECRDRR